MELSFTALLDVLITHGWPAALALMWYDKYRDLKAANDAIKLKDQQLLELTRKTAEGLANANSISSSIISVLSAGPRKQNK